MTWNMRKTRNDFAIRAVAVVALSSQRINWKKGALFACGTCSSSLCRLGAGAQQFLSWCVSLFRFDTVNCDSCTGCITVLYEEVAD